MGYRLGWSDIVLFVIFENWHHAADQVCYYEYNSKNKTVKTNLIRQLN